jgi:ATP-dependent DNA helicase RecG
MTATPIPRTVAMTVFGDLDTSVLSELPAGRAPITTSVVPALDKPAWLARAWQRVTEEVAAGRQAYVVCTRIGNEDEPAPDGDGEGAGGFSDLDPDDGTEPTDDGAPTGEGARYAVLETMAQLAAGPLAGLRIDTLHGRMSSDDKDRVMRQFSAGDIDVLVATTVVEVGVDVPNATVMVILDAERYGVSQLHQLRGRVGRGSAAGLCLLVTEQPDGSPAAARLEAVAATTDGFKLAQLDLEQRREGDVLGAAQSGRQSSLKLLSLLRDEELIMQARDVARQLVADDPDLSRQPVLAERVAGLMADERSRYLDKA